MVEYPPHLWNADGNKHIVYIDFLPAETDAQYSPEVEVVGDLAHALWMLNERVARDGAPSYDFKHQANVRAKMLEDFAAHADDDTEGRIRPQKAIWDVRKALGPNDILFSGVGAHKMWTGRYYHCNEPNTCIIPNGFCSMGMPLPGAIAASMIHKDRNIFAIAGDGDFLMNVQEMETARRLNSNITVMLWEDGGYGLISWKQDQEFGEHTDLAFSNPDWGDLAKSFGWDFAKIENARDLSGAIKDALAHDGPSLIVVPIDYKENMLLTERLGAVEGTL